MTKTSQAQTPYLRAKKEWDERIGSAIVQAKNWRLLALITSVLALLLLVF